VQLKQGDLTAEPLVLIHPVGGDIYFYRDLNACFTQNRTVIALRCPQLYSGNAYDTVESMAGDYLSKLIDFGVSGPFIPAGSSFGGAVALEMAIQLQKNEKQPSKVIMIDTPAFTHLPAIMRDEEILNYLVRYGLNKLAINHDDYDACKSIEDKIIYLEKISDGTLFEEILKSEFLSRFLKTWQNNANCLHRYRPPPYTGEVLFFSHAETMPEFPTNQIAHWKKILSGTVENALVPGNHISMMTTPNVKVIADTLSTQLTMKDTLCC